MNDFVYEYPVRVFLREGMVKAHLTEELSRLGDVIMLVYGGGSVKKNGRLDEVRSLIAATGRRVVEFSGIMPNPTWKIVKEAAAIAKDNNASGILALGGGSVMDASKIIALQAANEADVWDAEIHHRGELDRKALPLGAIVTSSGTGSEMNGGAVITNEEERIKTGLFASAPVFSFLDYHYMETVPACQVLSGAYDTLSHAMETYFGTSSVLNPSDDISLAVMRNTVDNIRKVIANTYDREARSNLMWDSAMAENGILKLGRFTDFEVHQIEHQLGAYTDCNHGEGLTVLQPVYCRYVYREDPAKFARFARLVFDVKEDDDLLAAEKGIDELYALICEMGLPHRLRDLKMKEEAEKLLADETLRAIANSTNLLVHGPKTLTADDVYAILKEAL